MSYSTRQAALRSLHEFSPVTRARHTIVRFYSEAFKAYRYARVFS
jgi:hypothetical protein